MYLKNVWSGFAVSGVQPINHLEFM